MDRHPGGDVLTDHVIELCIVNLNGAEVDGQHTAPNINTDDIRNHLVA